MSFISVISMFNSTGPHRQGYVDGYNDRPAYRALYGAAEWPGYLSGYRSGQAVAGYICRI